MKKVSLSSVRVFVTGQNLFTLKKYSGFTAELPGFNATSSAGIVTTGSPTTQGIELNAYPTPSTLVAGLNIGF
ncbi:hypothetical protein GO730_27725 [Spirosoma sp. HMF3257]|uniref:TonB-dependent receptor n=1 Tax=Spirosoma telluris TaxID=2183553 RepID=A0A327NT82_9BACT|nr:hypothetical protein [Spirosoma telluris]RAI77014.1 hypothetical protein HMF3257_27655 [Spirosoma telluris]